METFLEELDALIAEQDLSVIEVVGALQYVQQRLVIDAYVDGDDNGVQTHYVVIKHSGETTVVPFSATEGINWGSDLTDWIKGIRQKYSQ